MLEFVIAFGVLLAVFFACVYIPSIPEIKALKTAQKEFALPAGARWASERTYDISIQVNVNHGTGLKADWRRAISFYPYGAPGGISVIHLSETSMPFYPLESESKTATYRRMVQWMHEQYIATDEFTVPIGHPLEGGKWEVYSHVTSSFAKVNGLDYIPKGRFGDYRDILAALIHAVPEIEKEHKVQLAQERQRRSIQRVMAAQSSGQLVTARSRKNYDIEGAKVDAALTEAS